MKFSSVKLGEVCDVLAGNAWAAAKFNTDGIGMPVIRIQNVASVIDCDFVYWNESYDERFVVRAGDILLTLSGSFRVESWQGPEALLNQRIVELSPSQLLDERWFLNVLQTRLAEIEGLGRHALVNNVSIGDMKNLEIPLPPLPEQRRIAAILDKADALRAKRREALAQLDELTQSIFIEMFGDESSTKPLEDIATLKRGPFGGALKKEIFVADGPMVYEQRNAIQDDCLTGRYFISESKYREMEDFAVFPNDLIISCSGTLGKVAIAPTSTPRGIINQALLRVRVDSSLVTPLYLKHALESRVFQDKLSGFSHGTGLQNFPPMSEVKTLRIPVPDMKDQVAFENHLNRISHNKDLADESVTDLNFLFSSLQHRAFQGEL